MLSRLLKRALREPHTARYQDIISLMLREPDIFSSFMLSMHEGERVQVLLTLRLLHKDVDSNLPPYLFHLLKHNHDAEAPNGEVSTRLASKATSWLWRARGMRMLRANIALSMFTNKVGLTVDETATASVLQLLAHELRNAGQDFGRISILPDELLLHVKGGHAARVLSENAEVLEALPKIHAVHVMCTIDVAYQHNTFLEIVSAIPITFTSLRITFVNMVGSPDLMYVSDFASAAHAHIRDINIVGAPCALARNAEARCKNMQAIDVSQVTDVAHVRSVFPNLVNCTIFDHGLTSVTGMEGMHSLRRFRMNVCSEQCLASLRSAVPTWTGLEKLEINLFHRDMRFDMMSVTMPPNLTYLSVNNVIGFEDYIKSNSGLHRATKLFISMDRTEPQWRQTILFQVLMRHPCAQTLKTLMLDGSQCTSVPMSFFVRCPKLQKFAIVNDLRVQTIDLDDETGTPALVSLRIYQCPEFGSSFAWLPSLTHLERLELELHNTNAFDMASVRMPPNITYLNVNNVTGFQAYMDSKSGLHRLSTLFISMMHTEPAEMQASLGAAIEDHPCAHTLKTLSLDGAKCESVPESLFIRCRKLKTFFMTNNPAFRTIAPARESDGAAALVSMRITNCPMFTSTFASLTSLTNLNDLDVSGSGVTSVHQALLQQLNLVTGL